MREFSVIVAATKSMGIGKNGTLAWSIPSDMARFKSLTSTAPSENQTNIVIMGRKTWESIPNKFRPLSNRINIVLSRNPNAKIDLGLNENVHVVESLDNALSLCENDELIKNPGKIFIIGGASLYDEALKSSYCETIYLTEVLTDFDDLDTFIPVIPANKYKLVNRSKIAIENGVAFRYLDYQSFETEDSVISQGLEYVGNHEEQQYLDLIQEIITTGKLRGDRTGTGTYSKFGVQMRFSLRDGKFPLLTTKKVFWRGVAEELLWFIKGNTNAKQLSDKGIHIWDGNGSREFLDKLGLVDRVEGDLGPVYGFQWRHFGAEYKDMFTDYSGQGIDQLLDCINKIKNAPEDRRIIMTAWNPADLKKMALPPCHMFCQFYVANNELSCQMYQRSADMGLGVPFNIASYALLTYLVAQVCGLQPGDFVHSIGDAHVYSNHVDALMQQLIRRPREFPTIKINPDIKDIDNFQFEDFKIENYNPYSAIQMSMAV